MADLYRAHRRHQGPFFQTQSRRRVDRYFSPLLAAMIWSDAVRSNGEVGALEADPLFDTQEHLPTRFTVHPASYRKGAATVNVTFARLGGNVVIRHHLVRTRAGWKIDDIYYPEGTSLSGILRHG